VEFRGLDASGSERRGDHRGLLSVQLVPNYLGVSRRFALLNRVSFAHATKLVVRSTEIHFQFSCFLVVRQNSIGVTYRRDAPPSFEFAAPSIFESLTPRGNVKNRSLGGPVDLMHAGGAHPWAGH
jgi:hypothetical protein